MALAWGFWFLPVKLFPHAADMPRNLIISIAHIFLLPGGVLSIFIFYPSEATNTELFIWQVVMVTFNWLFYFGLFSLIALLRLRASRQLAG